MKIFSAPLRLRVKNHQAGARIALPYRPNYVRLARLSRVRTGMGRDLTTSSASQQDSEKTRLSRASWRLGDATLPNAARLLAALALGALLLALVYQLPVTHTVDIGGFSRRVANSAGFYRRALDARNLVLAVSPGRPAGTADTTAARLAIHRRGAERPSPAERHDRARSVSRRGRLGRSYIPDQ